MCSSDDIDLFTYVSSAASDSSGTLERVSSPPQTPRESENRYLRNSPERELIFDDPFWGYQFEGFDPFTLQEAETELSPRGIGVPSQGIELQADRLGGLGTGNFGLLSEPNLPTIPTPVRGSDIGLLPITSAIHTDALPPALSIPEPRQLQSTNATNLRHGFSATNPEPGNNHGLNTRKHAVSDLSAAQEYQVNKKIATWRAKKTADAALGSSTRLRVCMPRPTESDIRGSQTQGATAVDIGMNRRPGMSYFQVNLPGQSKEHSEQKRKKGRTSSLKPNGRKKAKEVRKIKACLRCHLQKLSCDGEEVCGSCKKVQGKTRIYRSICERLDIHDAIVFRIGNSKFNQDEAKIREYPSWKEGASAREMCLVRPKPSATQWSTCGYSPVLRIQVKEFVPGPSDITAERWSGGLNGKEDVILELPPFAAFDNESTTKALLTWVNENFSLYAKDMTAQGGDFVIGATFSEALRYVKKNPESVVKLALQIWIGTRMAFEFFCLPDDNDFGTSVVYDSNSVHDRQCPIAPVLDHQLDVLMIHEMVRMKRIVLDDIKAKIRSRKPEHWYEVYLTIFVLLCNLQYVYKSQKRWWEMHFNTGHENKIGKAYQSISYRFMERYADSAKNLLAHYRYVLKGPVPFTLDWDKEPVYKMAGIDGDAVKYVKFISLHVQSEMAHFKKLAERAKNNNAGPLDDDMFWISQLYMNVD